MNPRSTPKASFSTFVTGTTQLVVQEPAEITRCEAASYSSWLTPMITVQSSPLAGAEMITFCTLSCRCREAPAWSRNCPVDSITTSTSASPHGISAGSFSLNTATSWPSTVKALSPSTIAAGKGP